MKTKQIICAFSLGVLCMLPQLQAQDGYDFTVSEGYDFSDDEDEINAQKKQAADEKRALQSLIYNGAQYALACRKAYQEDVVWPISSCCDGIIGNNDLVECTKDPVPADLHREAISKINGKHPFAIDAGQFIEGVLSRSTLAKAKPNLTAQQYAEIEHVITRAENLAKWFYGTFAKACAVHDYDFLKEVQRVARFKEYLKTPKIADLDEKYYALMDAFVGNYVNYRVQAAFKNFNNNPKVRCAELLQHFSYPISTADRDRWISFLILGGSSRSSYTGPTFGVSERFEHREMDNPFMYFDIQGGKVVWAATGKASELSGYMRYFEFWSQNRVIATVDLADSVSPIVKKASNELLSSLSPIAGDIVVKEDADFKRTVDYQALYALNKLVTLDDELGTFMEYLDKNSRFVKNRTRTSNHGSLMKKMQFYANEASIVLDRMMDTARKK